MAGLSHQVSGDSSADRFDFPATTARSASKSDDDQSVSQDEFDAEAGGDPVRHEYDEDEDGYADGQADTEADALDPYPWSGGGDIDCDDLDGPVEVGCRGDPYGLDADGDGIGCEPYL